MAKQKADPYSKARGLVARGIACEVNTALRAAGLGNVHAYSAVFDEGTDDATRCDVWIEGTVATIEYEMAGGNGRDIRYFLETVIPALDPTGFVIASGCVTGSNHTTIRRKRMVFGMSGTNYLKVWRTPADRDREAHAGLARAALAAGLPGADRGLYRGAVVGMEGSPDAGIVVAIDGKAATIRWQRPDTKARFEDARYALVLLETACEVR